MSIITDVRKALTPFTEEKYKKTQQGFFKEGIILHGVRAKNVDAIAKTLFAQVKTIPKPEFFIMCESLIATGYQEETAIAYQWLWRRKKEFVSEDFVFLSSLIAKYADNWSKIDGLCTKAFGYFLAQYPKHFKEVQTWVTSKNRWVRRASAVSYIYAVRYEKKYLQDVFMVCDALLMDEDDLVRKGYGWLLKVASDVFPEEVFAYILKKKDRMPRVALRYAIEKMSKEWKKSAMA